MEVKELTNGNYWLVQVKYPIAQDCSNYYISSTEKINNERELIEDCIDDYSYIDEPLEEDYEDTEDFLQEYNDWYENTRNSVEIIFNKITPKLVENFGENFFENLELL